MAKKIMERNKDKTIKQPRSFEEALQRLEEIVNLLERAEAPLEKALDWYEEAVRLSRYCSEQLASAERRVEILEDKNGSLQGRPFPAASDALGAEGVLDGSAVAAETDDEEDEVSPDDEEY